jgi:hypothetical protein
MFLRDTKNLTCFFILKKLVSVISFCYFLNQEGCQLKKYFVEYSDTTIMLTEYFVKSLESLLVRVQLLFVWVLTELYFSNGANYPSTAERVRMLLITHSSTKIHSATVANTGSRKSVPSIYLSLSVVPPLTKSPTNVPLPLETD